MAAAAKREAWVSESNEQDFPVQTKAPCFGLSGEGAPLEHEHTSVYNCNLLQWFVPDSDDIVLGAEWN